VPHCSGTGPRQILAHQRGLAREERFAASGGNLHVVGIGELIEVPRRLNIPGPQVNKDKDQTQCRGKARRREPYTKHQQRRCRWRDPGGRQISKQPFAGHHHPAG
jgi:hypothetical protein